MEIHPTDAGTPHQRRARREDYPGPRQGMVLRLPLGRNCRLDGRSEGQSAGVRSVRVGLETVRHAGHDHSAARLARRALDSANPAGVGGHVYGLWAAHRVSINIFGDRKAAFRSQLPMLVRMICFSIFSHGNRAANTWCAPAADFAAAWPAVALLSLDVAPIRTTTVTTTACRKRVSVGLFISAVSFPISTSRPACREPRLTAAYRAIPATRRRRSSRPAAPNSS